MTSRSQSLPPPCCLIPLSLALSILAGTGCSSRPSRVQISLSAWPQILETVVEEQGFRMGEPGHERFLGRGWDEPEQDPDGRYFRWAVGDTVEVYIPVAEPRDLTVRFRWAQPAAPSGELQGIVACVDGVEVARASITSRRFHWFDLSLPRRAVHRGTNTLTLIPSLRVTSAEDPRPLRFCVREITWGQGQGQPPADAEEAQLRRVAAESGLRALFTNEVMRLDVAVPRGSVLRVSAEAMAGGRHPILRVSGEEATGEEIALWSGDVAQTDGYRQVSIKIRRDLRAVALSADGAVAIRDVTVSASARPADAPLLVLVTADGLSAAAWDEVRARGAGWGPGGTVFTHAFVPSTAVVPSYCSLMTGCYPFVHGVADDGEFRLSDAAPTVATVLAGRGYRCLGVVSDPLLSPELSGLARGFASFSYPVQSRRSPRAAAREAVHAVFREWVALSPGFIWLQVRPTPSGDAEGGDQLREDDSFAQPADQIEGCLVMIRRALSQVGLDRRVAVVICGGPWGGDPSMDIRQELADSSIRVPLLVRPLDGAAAVTTEEAVSLVDVAPTLLAMAGVPPPLGLHGRTLLSPARGGTAQGPVFCEARRGRAVAVVRPPLKLIQAADLQNPPQELPGGMHLVDTALDPFETLNVLSVRVSDATDLSEAWLRLVGETIPRFRPVSVEAATTGHDRRGG